MDAKEFTEPVTFDKMVAGLDQINLAWDKLGIRSQMKE
jgi:hypothetical protein